MSQWMRGKAKCSNKDHLVSALKTLFGSGEIDMSITDSQITMDLVNRQLYRPMRFRKKQEAWDIGWDAHMDERTIREAGDIHPLATIDGTISQQAAAIGIRQSAVDNGWNLRESAQETEQGPQLLFELEEW